MVRWGWALAWITWQEVWRWLVSVFAVFVSLSNRHGRPWVVRFALFTLAFCSEGTWLAAAAMQLVSTEVFCCSSGFKVSFLITNTLPGPFVELFVLPQANKWLNTQANHNLSLLWNYCQWGLIKICRTVFFKSISHLRPCCCLNGCIKSGCEVVVGTRP